MRFVTHGERVIRTADSRAGKVKDIAGHEANVIWDGTDIRDPASREWVPITDLDAAPAAGHEES